MFLWNIQFIFGWIKSSQDENNLIYLSTVSGQTFYLNKFHHLNWKEYDRYNYDKIIL